MTQAKAQTVVSALIGQGYRIGEVGQRADGQWYVDAFQSSGATDVATIQTFATNNAVTGLTDRARFV